MNDQFDEMEEKLKRKDQPKKEIKVSGKSVFEIKKIIEQKGEDEQTSKC